MHKGNSRVSFQSRDKLLHLGRRKLDSGSAAFVLVLFLGLIGASTLALGYGIELATAKARVQLIADLAALSGADNLAGIVAGYPCDTAAEIAQANGASLVSCRIVGEALSVSVGKKALGFELSADSLAAPG